MRTPAVYIQYAPFTVSVKKEKQSMLGIRNETRFFDTIVPMKTKIVAKRIQTEIYPENERRSTIAININ